MVDIEKRKGYVIYNAKDATYYTWEGTWHEDKFRAKLFDTGVECEPLVKDVLQAIIIHCETRVWLGDVYVSSKFITNRRSTR